MKGKITKWTLKYETIKTLTPSFPLIRTYSNIKKNKKIKVYVKCLDSAFLITNLFSFLIPRRIRSHEYEEDFIQINLVGIDDVVPMIHPKKYGNELPEWKRGWKLWVKSCFEYALNLNNNFIGRLFNQHPFLFIKYFHIIFPVHDRLIHKREEVKKYLKHLHMLRKYLYNKKEYFVWLLEKSLRNYELDKYDKIIFVGKDSAGDILARHMEIFPRSKSVYYIINPINTYNETDKLQIYNTEAFMWNHKKDRFIDIFETKMLKKFTKLING